MGEQDLVVQLVGREHGRLDAVAHGALRARSRFQGFFEPFTRLKTGLYRRSNGTLWTLREAEVIAFPPRFVEWRRTVALQSAAELLMHSGPYEGLLEEFYGEAAGLASELVATRDPLAVLAAFAVAWSLSAGFGLPSAPIRSGAARFCRQVETDPASRWRRYEVTPQTARVLWPLLGAHVETHIERAWRGWRMLTAS